MNRRGARRTGERVVKRNDAENLKCVYRCIERTRTLLADVYITMSGEDDCPYIQMSDWQKREMRELYQHLQTHLSTLNDVIMNIKEE